MEQMHTFLQVSMDPSGSTRHVYQETISLFLCDVLGTKLASPRPGAMLEQLVMEEDGP